MRESQRLLTAAAIAILPACGIPMEQYDARTAELRQAEDKVKACGDAVKQEQGKTADAQAGLEEMRSLVKDLQSERKQLGVNSAADIPAIRTATADAAKARQASGEHKAERDRLAANLKAELDGGVIWLDDRGGVLRMVLPEEALFSPTNANIGPPGKKVLDAIIREIKAMPPHEIVVAAFVDRTDKSKADKDMALTLDRAWHVADYFGKQGVDKSLVAAAGYGELEPIADNGNESVRQRNRRVEVLVLGPVALPTPSTPAPVATPSPSTTTRQPASTTTRPTTAPATTPPAAGIIDDPGM